MGGVPGDLLVVIEATPHETLQRNGKNLHYDLYIPFTDAALGAQAEVPLVGSKAKSPSNRAPKAAASCDSAQGTPAVDSYGQGDLLVNINVWTPRSSPVRSANCSNNSASPRISSPMPTTRKRASLTRCGICSLDG